MGPMSLVCADPHWPGLCPVKTDKTKHFFVAQTKAQSFSFLKTLLLRATAKTNGKKFGFGCFFFFFFAEM